MSNFRVHYSGACFETGDSAEQVEKKVHNRLASLGEIMDIVATPVHPTEQNLLEENYVVSLKAGSWSRQRQV